ncbi:hypothetical protein V8C86DRAFT_3004098 [Haematococcus lacustris]
MKRSTPRGGSKEVQARLAPSSLGSQQKGDPVIVSSYAYKGGSTKTTVTCFLACALAKKGKRVLLVDADHQGNTTIFFYNAELPEAAIPNGLVAFPRPRSRCLSAVTTTQLPNTERTQPITSTAVTHADKYDSVWRCYSKRQRYDVSDYVLKPVQEKQYKDTAGEALIHLMPSSPDLERLQPYMADNQVENINSLRAVIIKAAAQVKADFVIIDLGPTPDNLNRACVLISDVVQPTTNGNCIFNWMGAHSLITTILPKWFEFSQEKELNMFPYILPFMANRFAVEDESVKQNDANFINGLNTSLDEFRGAIGTLQHALANKSLTAEQLIEKLKPVVNSTQVEELANSIRQRLGKHRNYIKHASKVLDHMLTARSGHHVEAILPQTRHMAVCHEVGQPLFDIGYDALKTYYQETLSKEAVEDELKVMKPDITLFKNRFAKLATRFSNIKDVLQTLKAEESSDDNDDDDMDAGEGASKSKPRKTHARGRSSQQAGGGKEVSASPLFSGMWKHREPRYA